MPTIPGIEDKLTERYKSLVDSIAHGKTPDLDPETTQLYSDLFNQDIETGYGSKWAKSKPGSIEFERLAKMRANAMYFAASKQVRIIEDLKIMQETTDPETFKQLAEGYYHTQNRSWLQAEREMIQANAQMAKRWHDIQLMKGDLPTLTYDTAGDDRVRPEHQALDGITKPVDDPFWRTHYPPIAPRCRCDVQQGSKKITPDSALPDYKINKAYAFNSGIENRVTGKEHPYLASVFKEKKNRVDMMQHCTQTESLTTFFKSKNRSLQISSFADITNMKAFNREYIAAKSLVNYGLNVIMRAYHPFGKKGMFNPDYIIDGVIFDLKTAKTHDLNDALTNSFKSAGDQDVSNIVFDITACNVTIKAAYKIITKKLMGQKKIKEIIILKNGKIYKL